MAMKRCRECGFPYWLSKLIRWNENGTITMAVNPDYRVVIIESDFLSHIFSRIEEHLGLPISHLVFEAQRNASVHTIDSQLNRFPFTLGRWGPSKRVVVRAFCHLAVWLGQAYARPLRYRSGKGGEAVIRNPYNRELMAAIVLGAFESLERRPFEHAWTKEDGEDVVSIRPVQARPEISRRLDLAYPALKPGHFHMPRCRSCGTPIELGYLRWNEGEGIIMDNRRNTRLTFLDGYVPTIVFREMEKELGEDIYPLIIQAEKDYTHRRMRDLGMAGGGGVLPRRERESIYENALATLPPRGQGNPVDYRYGYDGLTVTVDNPYNEHLLAGQMAALFEVAEGKAAEVEWHSPSPSSLVFTVRSAEALG
ncbi:MAG: hypothetical protein PHP28_05265 [Actinomycetota bacterium]|nr:hypothetical protein [Actinomycetota bacterium]MDD5666963.1 hypothetical protein [Actinomycetota bacterium]